MPKAKNLNGLPNNLVKSYLGTLAYYNGGYMADWLVLIARQNKVSKIEIDVLKESLSIKNLNKDALLSPLGRLKKIIALELKVNDLPVDFIKEAQLQFDIFPDKKMIKCFSFVKGMNGKVYKTKKAIYDTAYEKEFSPKKLTRFSIKSLFKRWKFE